MPDPYATLHVEVVSTVDRVADELRRALFDGELEAGTPLREVALAESLGVSRSTVREALGVLVAEGLLTREPHRGVAVTSPDPASIHDLCRAREVLEIAGVRRWPAACHAQRRAVRDALDAYTATVAAGASYQQLNERHLAFHLSLVDLAGSPRLTAMAESIYAEMKLALAQVDRMRRNAHAQADSHVVLVEMLERDDIDSCARELAAHLDDAESAILAALALPPATG